MKHSRTDIGGWWKGNLKNLGDAMRGAKNDVKGAK
jgi:hypothetical protein